MQSPASTPVHFPQIADGGGYSTSLVLLNKRGTDMVLLSRFLGHANPTVTQNIYVDPFPEEVRKAGETFKIDMKQKGAKKGNGSFSGMQTVGDRANLLHLSVPGWRNWQTHRT